VTRQLHFTPKALENLSELDAGMARPRSNKIQWLAEHSGQVQPEMPDRTVRESVKTRVLFAIDPAPRNSAAAHKLHSAPAIKDKIRRRLVEQPPLRRCGVINIVPLHTAARFNPPWPSSTEAIGKLLQVRHVGTAA